MKGQEGVSFRTWGPREGNKPIAPGDPLPSKEIKTQERSKTSVLKTIHAKTIIWQ